MTLRKWKHGKLVAYLILAIATGLSFQQERLHSNENRAAVAANAHQALKAVSDGVERSLLAGCHRNNDLRAVLRGIVKDSRKQIAKFEAKGTIDAGQAHDARAQINHELKVLANVPCSKVTNVS